MAKRRRRTAAPTAAPPAPLSVLNPPDPALPYFWMGDDPLIQSHDAGVPLPREAVWYAHPDAPWQLISRGEPAPPAPPFLTDAALALTDLRTHELFASPNLTFAWLPLLHASPTPLPHPDEPDGVFHRVNLAFLGWVRGVAKRARDKGATFTPEQQRAVDRVWSYVCNREGIYDDDRSRLPEPGGKLPE